MPCELILDLDGRLTDPALSFIGLLATSSITDMDSEPT